MTDWEYRREVYKLAKIAVNRDRWGPELFKSLQRSCYEGLSHEREPCVFNILRKIMGKKEYVEIDLAYSCYFMPGAKEDYEYIKNKKNERTTYCTLQKLLQEKKNLLEQRSKLLKKRKMLTQK